VDAAGQFRPNEPRISGEIIEGELVIVDFDTGRYFSSENVGPYVWTLLSEGISVEGMTVAPGPHPRCRGIGMASGQASTVGEVELQQAGAGG